MIQQGQHGKVIVFEGGLLLLQVFAKLLKFTTVNHQTKLQKKQLNRNVTPFLTKAPAPRWPSHVSVKLHGHLPTLPHRKNGGKQSANLQ